MAATGTQEPLRVAIVGSGPAGFYAAEHLLKDAEREVRVDMFDRLPTPFGLVRAGVAPDHPKIKSVTRMYEKTAAREGFRFFGNVEIGRHLTAHELADRYHAVIYAHGTANDRRLGIPGEELAGSHPATHFVAWYNAHPDFAGHDFDLSCERAVVIGNGNVAADVARMLALTPDELAETDTADHAIAAFATSDVCEIVILGRRGPLQAAFTSPEVRELGEMADADVVIDPADAELDPISAEEVEAERAEPTNLRNVDLLKGFAEKPQEGKRKRIVLRFFRSPVEIQGDGKVERIVVGRNELVRDETGQVRARDTGERETIECGLVLRSIGYVGTGIDGVPFDERRGVIPNEAGRVTDGPGGAPVAGLYTVGWIKRGPSGVIGTNKKDALETVTTLLADVDAGAVPAIHCDEPIEELLDRRAPDAVSFAGWQAIDATEQERGRPHGRPRVKFVSVHEMVEAMRTGQTVG
ncbi:FAD-dependent oxidoreductase [Thermoleophilia bacterium SCSIO 60948]|nr:FAD-dependent oxidoreductase [Thermoleophilia bacterium SCSIO 60948]